MRVDGRRLKVANRMKELRCLSSLSFSLQKILTVMLETFLCHILRQMHHFIVQAQFCDNEIFLSLKMFSIADT